MLLETWYCWYFIARDGHGDFTEDMIWVFNSVESSGSWIMTEVVSTESANNVDYPSTTIDDETIHATWSDSTDYSGSGEDKDIL